MAYRTVSRNWREVHMKFHLVKTIETKREFVNQNPGGKIKMNEMSETIGMIL
jgi:hypothetical protein